MEIAFPVEILGILIAALIGGILAKSVKLQPIVGFIFSGIIYRAIFPSNIEIIQNITEIGLVFLLFSIGLELSLNRLKRFFKIAIIGGITQIFLTTLLCYILLITFKLASIPALILSLGFSLSSTAVVVKTLLDMGKTDTLEGEIMLGWLLFQDLAVIPMMILIYSLADKGPASYNIFLSLIKAAFALILIMVLGRYAVPRFLHKVSSLNSREILVLTAVTLATGIAFVTSLLGISPALGAFLAGVVISESQENLAVFAETRPLRDLFVALFFVSLGFLVDPSVVISNLPLILVATIFIILIKAIIVLIISLAMHHHGKTAISISLGLSQIGEFSFVLFSLAGSLKLLSNQASSIGIAIALLSLVLFPLIYRKVDIIWKVLKDITSDYPVIYKYFTGWDKNVLTDDLFKDHIIICGYGRVGGWVGKALDSIKVPYVVIDYNQEVIKSLKRKGVPVLFGDPSEKEILDKAGITYAKAVVIAVPDRVTQEGIISLCQTISPSVKIISRVHTNEDWERMKLLKIDKIVQPEFEAAMAIVKTMLFSMGKSKEEIANRIKSLRLSHATL